jgi:hypothetical protein
MRRNARLRSCESPSSEVREGNAGESRKNRPGRCNSGGANSQAGARMNLSSGLRPWTRGIPTRTGKKALKADDPVVFHSSEGKRAEK